VKDQVVIRPTSPPRRIALLRLSALGDVVLATPLVATLRRAFPDAELTWITTRGCHALLEGLEGVRFQVVDKIRSPLDWWRFRQSMQGERFDVVLAAQASLRASLMLPAIPADRRIGFDRARARDLQGWFVNQTVAARDEHLADGFLGFAGALGVPEHDWIHEFRIPMPAAVREEVSGWLPTGPFLVINPAASKPERNWSGSGYAAIAARVRSELGWAVVLTGGRSGSDRRLADHILAGGRQGVVDLVGQTTPRQLAGVLERAEALLAPDTGPVHIATALGTPVVGLYAVARPELTGPYRATEWCVNRYPEAVRECLGRDPERVGWHVRVHDRKAMERITVDAVWERVAALAYARNRKG
jgi:heptosyltransferase I